MPIVKSNGININYEECGSGEPLLLIMGLSAPGAAWELHVNEYKKHFRCIVLDNRGAGASDKPPGDYTTELMASDSVNVMDSLGIDRFHVNGISMGGAIAQQIAIANPSRVKSCVMTATWAFEECRRHWGMGRSGLETSFGKCSARRRNAWIFIMHWNMFRTVVNC